LNGYSLSVLKILPIVTDKYYKDLLLTEVIKNAGCNSGILIRFPQRLRHFTTTITILALLSSLIQAYPIITNKTVAKALAVDAEPTEANPSAFAQVQWGMPSNYLNYLADNFNFIYSQQYGYEFTPAQLSSLHQRNPQIKVIKYRSSAELFNSTSSASFNDPASWSRDFALRQNTEAEWNNIWTNQQDWFLKNSSGNYINRRANAEMAGNRAYVMDPANEAWRTFIANKIQSFIDSGFDGVFLDLVTTTYWSGPGYGWDSRPINPRTGALYTDSQWRNDLMGLVERVQQQLGSDKIVIFNGIFNGSEYYANNTTAPYLEDTNASGQMIEGFAPWDSNGFYSQSNWKKNIDLLARISSKPSPYRVLVQAYAEPANASAHAQGYEGLARYALASYLLGKNGNSTLFHIAFGSNYPVNTGLSSWWEKDIPLYHLKVGDPVGSYYLQDNLYQRDYTNGKVLVNPTDAGASVSLELDAYYKDPDGQIVTSVTLPSKSGTILVKYADFEPAPSPDPEPGPDPSPSPNIEPEPVPDVSPSPSPDPTPTDAIDTKLSLTAKPGLAKAAPAVTLNGQLKDNSGNPVANKKIRIQQKIHKKIKNRIKGKLKVSKKWLWKTIAILKTNSKGNLSRRVKPKKTAVYRAEFTGNANLKGSSSKSVKVPVSKKKS